MSEGVHGNIPDACPLPPAGFEIAQIPIYELDPVVTSLLRIHLEESRPNLLQPSVDLVHRLQIRRAE